MLLFNICPASNTELQPTSRVRLANLARPFGELFGWSLEDKGIPYYRKGPATFEYYHHAVIWSQTEEKGATGYLDPGGVILHRCQRRPNSLTPMVSGTCTRTTITECPLVKNYGVSALLIFGATSDCPWVAEEAFGQSSAEHARARCLSGCLRHSGSLIPNPGELVGLRRGLSCAMDSGGWFIID